MLFTLNLTDEQDIPMKKLAVKCIDSNFEAHPNLFVVELLQAHIERIKAVASQVQGLKLNSAEYYDHVGEYFTGTQIENIMGNSNGKFSELTEFMIDLTGDDDDACVEMRKVEVLPNSVRFTCVPMHCDDTVVCRTCEVPLPELDNEDTFVSESLVTA